MIRYRFVTPSGTIDVWIESINTTDRHPVQFSSAVLPSTSEAVVQTRRRLLDHSIENLKALIARSCGPWGHTIGSAASQQDLQAAMSVPPLSLMSPQLVEGTIVSYNLELPEGAIS